MRRFAFRWRLWVAGLLAGVALLWVPAALGPQQAAAHGGETVTTELQPGWNLAGWTEAEAPVSAVFKAIPQLEMAYAWDAAEQRFRGAARDRSGLLGDLETLTPGMGLWLHLGGDEPHTWTRPVVFLAGLADLKRGWNLVTWAGENSIAANALSELRNNRILQQTAGADGRPPQVLAKGDPVWLRLARAKQWWQLTTPPRIEFEGRFSAAQKRELQAYVDDVIAFFVRRHGVAVPDLTVKFGDATADMICGGYGGKVLFIKEACITAVPHEYSHAVQEYLAAHDAEGNWAEIPDKIGPSWLSEGVANYAAAVYEDLTGIGSIEQWTTASTEAGLANDNRLEAIEDDMSVGEAPNYELASLAVTWIIENHGEAVLYDFYRNRNEVIWWQTAFRDTFGMTVARFYEGFEDYRAELAARRPHIAGRVIGPDGKGVANVRVEAIPLEGGRQWRTITGTDGAFSNPTIDGIYKLWFFLGETPCHIGWYGGSDGHTFVKRALTPLAVPDGKTTGITVKLPRPLPELCGQIRGVLVNVDGTPYTEPPWVVASPLHDQDGTYTGKDSDELGRFALDVRANSVHSLSLHTHYVRECTVAPHPALDPESPPSRAWVGVGDADVTDIVITVTKGPRRAKVFVDCTVAR